MPFDNESVARDVKSLLETELSAALVVVAAAWAGIDAVTLPTPVTWHYGHKPEVVELESAAFPFVATIPTNRRPGRQVYGWGFQNQSITIYVDWFIVADDETTADKLCSRYGEAVLAVIQSQRAYAGYDLIDFEPAIDLSEASRHPKTLDADMLNDDHVDFIKLGRMTLEFGGE